MPHLNKTIPGQGSSATVRRCNINNNRVGVFVQEDANVCIEVRAMMCSRSLNACAGKLQLAKHVYERCS